MHILILFFFSFGLFAASVEDQLKELDQCLDKQEKSVEKAQLIGRKIQRKVWDGLEKAQNEYESKNILTRNISFLVSVATMDSCPENPSEALTSAGKFKSYRKRLADIGNLNDDLISLKDSTVDSSMTIADYLYDRRNPEKSRHPKVLKELVAETNKADKLAVSLQKHAQKYNISLPWKSCRSIALKLLK